MHHPRTGRLALPIAALMLLLLACTPSSASAPDGPRPPTLDVSDDALPTYYLNSGNGTAGNPYVIADQEIYVDHGIGFELRRSDSYYILRNLTITGNASGTSEGIYCGDSSNVTLDGVVLRDLSTAICLSGCEWMRCYNVTVDRCYIGIQLFSDVHCSFHNCSLTDIDNVAMEAEGFQDLSFDGCSVRTEIHIGFQIASYGSGFPDCRGINLTDCVVSDATLGLSFSGVDGARVDGCDISGGWPADVYLDDAKNLTMVDTDLGAGGLWVMASSRGLDIRDSNTVEGKPLLFLDGAGGTVVNSDAGQVILVDCRGTLVENLTFEGIAHPVTMLWSSGCTVRNCTFMDAHIVVQATAGGSNRIEDVTIGEGGHPYAACGIEVTDGGMAVDGLNVTGVEVGIHAIGGYRLDVSNSSFADIRSRGVLAEGPLSPTGGIPLRNLVVSRCRFYNVSSGIVVQNWNLTIRDSRLEECGSEGLSATSTTPTAMEGSKFSVERTEVVGRPSSTGISLYGVEGNVSSASVRGPSYGIVLGSRTICTLWRCDISECGIGLRIAQSYKVTVTECNVTDCTYQGIDVYRVYEAKLHHNNLIRNNYDPDLGQYTSTQAIDDSTGAVWDDGSEGNYWGDYGQWYPDATAVGRVWDTPYALAGSTSRQDRFPLAVRYDHNPPVAEAGPERTVGEGQAVQFDGGACSDDVGIVDYAWEFVYQGQPVSLHGLTASHVFSALGAYTVTLRVADEWGNTASDTTVVRVVDQVAPVAEAGDDLTVDVGIKFRLDGSASSDDHGIVAYAWTVDPGGLDLALRGASVELSIDVQGRFDVVLNVTDAYGNWATDSMALRVLDRTPPAAEAGPDIEVGQHAAVTLDGSGSTDNVGIVRWDWTFEYGGEPVALEGMVVEFTFDLAGLYEVALRVTDAAALSSRDAMLVSVRDTEPPVAAVGGDLTVDQGASAALSAAGSTDNVGIVSYRWSLAEEWPPVTCVGPELVRTWGTAGEFDVVLEVWDAAGNEGTCTATVTVRDTTPPVARAGVDLEVDQHAPFALDGSGSSDGVGIVSYTWTCTVGGLPVTLTGPQPTVTFDLAGPVLITLTAVDAAGNTATDTLTVTVRDIEPPVAVAGGDRTVIEGEAVTLDATASSDNVGIASYAWTIFGEGSTESLTGPVVALAARRPGTLLAEVRVTDAAGNTGKDSLDVRVLPLNVSWRLGPFIDEDGDVLEGVRVSVTLNGTEREGVTDAAGWVELAIPRHDLVSPAQVEASKRGFGTVRFAEALDADGSPADPVPRMKALPGTLLASGPLPWLILAAVAVCLVVAAILLRTRRARGARRP